MSRTMPTNTSKSFFFEWLEQDARRASPFSRHGPLVLFWRRCASSSSFPSRAVAQWRKDAAARSIRLWASRSTRQEFRAVIVFLRSARRSQLSFLSSGSRGTRRLRPLPIPVRRARSPPEMLDGVFVVERDPPPPARALARRHYLSRMRPPFLRSSRAFFRAFVNCSSPPLHPPRFRLLACRFCHARISRAPEPTCPRRPSLRAPPSTPSFPSLSPPGRARPARRPRRATSCYDSSTPAFLWFSLVDLSLPVDHSFFFQLPNENV